MTIVVRIKSRMNNYGPDYDNSPIDNTKYKVLNFGNFSNGHVYAICYVLNGNRKGEVDIIKYDEIKVIQDYPEEFDRERLSYLNEMMSTIKNIK